jgi:hypothetical protein
MSEEKGTYLSGVHEVQRVHCIVSAVRVLWISEARSHAQPVQAPIVDPLP